MIKIQTRQPERSPFIHFAHVKLPKMQLSPWVTSLEAIYPITCSFLRSHKTLYATVFTYAIVFQVQWYVVWHAPYLVWLSKNIQAKSYGVSNKISWTAHQLANGLCICLSSSMIVIIKSLLVIHNKKKKKKNGYIWVKAENSMPGRTWTSKTKFGGKIWTIAEKI